MIRGTSFNVAINPQGAKQLLPAETFAPNHLELRNGVRTDGGFYKQRPGFKQEWSVGVPNPIHLLIPFKRSATNGLGYAVTVSGVVYELLTSQAVQAYTGAALSGTFRPTWSVFDGIPIIVDGQAPIKINVTAGPTVNTISILGGSPPAGKFIAVIADRVVISGQDDTSFDFSSPGSSEIWPGNTTTVTGHGEKIEYMTVMGTDLWFFKTASVEVWQHIGGIAVFGRRGIIPVLDKFSRNRGIVGFSVVEGDDAFYFYADGDFWEVTGFRARRISQAYKREIGLLPSSFDMYGFHYAKEHVIRWHEPTSGSTFVYDYQNGVFTEDNLWSGADWRRMPIFSYMETDGRAYIGDFDPTGVVSEWSDEILTDKGNEIRLFREFRSTLTASGKRARLNRALIRMQRGDGALGTDPKLLARWAIDGGGLTKFQSISTGEAKTALGSHGDYDPYVEIHNLGIGREIVFQLVQTAPVRHLMTHINFTAKELGR